MTDPYQPSHQVSEKGVTPPNPGQGHPSAHTGKSSPQLETPLGIQLGSKNHMDFLLNINSLESQAAQH